MIPSKLTTVVSLTFLVFALSATAQQPEGAMTQGEPSSSKGRGFFNTMGTDRPSGAQTEITAAQESSFDSEKNIAEFAGRVKVRDPQFTLTCDKLKVTLSPSRKGIALAEARGNVVIVQEKADPKSDTPKAIGRAGEVTYKPDSGEVVMRDWPSIQQGINNQVATEQSTVMFLRPSGQSHTVGGSKTVITDTGKKQ